MRPIIVIAGPTASGKSAIASKLAKKFNGYIINGDSRQIYKELNIGTAKPSTGELKEIPTYLYNSVSITKRYTLWDYQKDVFAILKKENDKLPFIVGGTGLYIDSAVFNYKLPKTKEADYAKDISFLNESDRNNPRRLTSFFQRETQPTKGKTLNHIYFVIDVEKEVLNERIERRIEEMFKQGLIEENEILYKKYKGKNISALKTLGYQEFEGYFNGDKTIEKVKEEILFHTRQYAKRQRTWFRRNKNAIWIKDISGIEKHLKEREII
ncbi:tRNA (adenosine(37)-N6)-dimethylallyltransferase MiaA [Candidatus Dojkabacteria bacterium]|jgi:tRNA dimethylallyltransferase|nr:tRNA (adenosine(37)-N6)-dimethylallyltransferase MiaA [Candidatus Dojkabacteria bacterium]